MIQILLEVEESIKKYRNHAASLEVSKGDAALFLGMHHVEHLTKAVFEGQSLDPEELHAAQLFLVEVLKLVH